MSLPVHLVPPLGSVARGQVVVVEGDEAHHAVVVRRLRVEEPVALTDGVGVVVIGTVTAADRGRLEVRVDSVDRRPREEPAITVVQGLPKGDRGERAVEVLTEIGVDRIVPWAAARSVAVWRGERAARSLAKWRATAREAAKQSRRVWFPDVAELVSTAELGGLLAGADLSLVLHEEAAVPLAALARDRLGVPERPQPVRSVLVVVGPEGGLTPDEVSTLTVAGGHPVRLGREILRTSTAGVAAVAAILAHTPRWR